MTDRSETTPATKRDIPPARDVPPRWWRALMPARLRKERPQVAVVRLQGAIGVVTPLRPGLSLSAVEGMLKTAFSMKRACAVAIAVNSPGGSPVQSTLIYRRIRQLAEEKKLPVYVFAEDVAASGGYLLACAGDEIYADASSIVGSIGVITAGFGLDKFIGRFDIERRVHTQGRNKGMLDPFQPEKPDDVKRLKAVQKDMHDAFTAIVRERRAGSLKDKESALFTGEFWSGTRALELGLVDGLGGLHEVLREKFGEHVRLRRVRPRRSLLMRRLGGMSGDARELEALFSGGRADLAADLISAVEARALWARFGL